MLNYQEAYNVIKTELSKIPLNVEQDILLDAEGRFLAEDIVSDINMPAFNNSAMDGFAVKFDDSIRQWETIGEISAGNYKEFEVDNKSCISIMTGARLPKSVDTVIPIEDVDVNGNAVALKSNTRYKKGLNVRLKAENLEIGNTVLKKGAIIESNHIPALATCGKRIVNVLKKLKIGALTTGDELVDIDFVPEGDQIRASNLYSIIQEIKSINAIPVNFGIIHDDRNSIKTKLQIVLSKEIDILVTSGAVSVGKYDFLQSVLVELGAEIIFWKVNIKPGKPLLFSKFNNGKKDILIFSLPGNPVSSFVNFKIFIRRAIYEVFGNKKLDMFAAELKEELSKKDGKRHFVRGISEYDENKRLNVVSKAGLQSSGDMYGLNNANCLIVLDEDIKRMEKGETVTCIKI